MVARALSSFEPGKRGFRVAITRDCPLRIPLVPRPRSRRDSLIKITEEGGGGGDLGALLRLHTGRIHARAKPRINHETASYLARVSRSNSSTRFLPPFLSSDHPFRLCNWNARGSMRRGFLTNNPPNPLRIDASSEKENLRFGSGLCIDWLGNARV